MQENKAIRKFGLLDKVAYMSGDVANDLSFIFVSMYLMLFYTKVLGISGSVVGLLFLTARLVDAFTDVGMGRLVDSMKERPEGKFRFWIKIASPFVCLSAFLLFVYIVKDFPLWLRIVYIFVTYILWGSICYTAVNIPYGSMASVISEKSEERASLSVFRSIGASISILIISYVVPKVIFVEKMVDGELQNVIVPERFTLLALVFSVSAFCFYMFCYNFSIERVKIKVVKSENKSSIMEEIAKLLNSLAKNRPLQAFVLVSLVFLLTNMLNQGLQAYLYIDYFNNKEVLAYAGMVTAILTFSISPVAALVVKKIGKKISGGISMVIAGLIFLLLYILKLDNAYKFFALFTTAYVGISYFNIIVWAFISDIIDDQQIRMGTREDGTVYAIYSFARKLGQALAGGLVGFILTWIGYQSAAAVQTDVVRMKIYTIFTTFQGVGYLIVGLLLLFVYPLSKKRVDSNIRKLNEIRNGISHE